MHPPANGHIDFGAETTWSERQEWLSIGSTDAPAPDGAEVTLHAVGGRDVAVTHRAYDGLQTEDAQNADRFILVGYTRGGVTHARFSVAVLPDGRVNFYDSCTWVANGFEEFAKAEIAAGRARVEADVLRAFVDPNTQPAEITAFNAHIEALAPQPPKAWAEKPPAERSYADADVPLEVRARVKSVRVTYVVPPSWVTTNGSLATCTRTATAQGTCVMVRTERIMSDVPVDGDQDTELFIGDSARLRADAFVESIGALGAHQLVIPVATADTRVLLSFSGPPPSSGTAPRSVVLG